MSGPPADEARWSDDGEALAVAAHELKNTLGPLVLMLDRLGLRAAAGETVAAADLAPARAQARRLSRLLEDLLDVSRIGRDQLGLRDERVDLAELAAEGVAAFHAAEARPVALDAPDGPCSVRGDRLRLGEIIANLMDNADKYSPAGTPIRVSVVGDGAHVRLAVSDQGPGIGPEDRARLFQKFQRGAAAAEGVRGLGLGLYICRQIAERHGGLMRVESEPGRGAMFVLEMPRARD